MKTNKLPWQLRQPYTSLMILAQWLVCSWLHRYVWVTNNKGKRVKRSGRCYPRVDIPEGQPGADLWHCSYCHPCGEVFDWLGVK